MTPKDLPKGAIWILGHLVPGEKNDALAGDLLEEFRAGRVVSLVLEAGAGGRGAGMHTYAARKFACDFVFTPVDCAPSRTGDLCCSRDATDAVLCATMGLPVAVFHDF